MKELSIVWNALPDTQKAKFVTDYDKEKEAYKKTISRVPEADLAEASKESAKKRATKVKNNAQAELKELLDELKKPARPLSSYMVYSSTRHSAMKEKGVMGKNAVKEIAEEWKNLSEQQKLIYAKKAEDAKEQYDKDISAWTKKMNKMGKLEQIMEVETKLAQAKKKIKDLDNWTDPKPRLRIYNRVTRQQVKIISTLIYILKIWYNRI